MAESESKSAGKNEAKPSETSSALQIWRPFESLRREIDRLFDDFDRPFRRSLFEVQPFWRRELSWSGTPAVDVVEKNNAYEIVAELPGMDEKNVEVKLSDGGLTITATKEEEKEEKRKDYHIQERHFGSFERSFRLPEGIDIDKIDATFKKGLLRVTLPKTAEARESAKKIEVKSS
jgi:HSP20 family protein